MNMKTKFNILILLSLFFPFCGCSEKTEKTPNLNGNWVNNQQDTLCFFRERSLEYKPHIPTTNDRDYFYEIIGDSISLQLLVSSGNTIKYYFKCNGIQIEIHNFQNVEYDIYKRLK